MHVHMTPSTTLASHAQEGGKLFTLSDGRKLEYFDSGTSGPVALMIHGGFQTGERKR